MTAAVFEARWNRILRSREQGYEELTDFMGRYVDLGPLVRTGLLRRREEDGEYQRYNGYVPTELGQDLLLYIPEKELILVRPEKSASLYLVLQNDRSPKVPFKGTYAEPTAKQFEVVREMRQNAGRDVWRTQRADQLETRLLAGFMDIRHFTVRTGIGAVWVEAAHKGFAAFAYRLGERALQNAQPVAVGQYFVRCIDHGHRIFQVQNSGQRRFHHHVIHTG